MVNKMNIFQIAVFLSSLVILSNIQITFAQYSGTESIESSKIWTDKVESILQDHLENELTLNPNISNDSIKTRISGSGEDVLPPRYHIRILYDLQENDRTKHMDLVYKVDFGPAAKTPDNAKLEKIYEEEYISPGQIKNKKFEEFESYLTGMLHNIMCKQGFEKIIRESNGSSVCVKSTSVEKLIERGWSKSEV